MKPFNINFAQTIKLLDAKILYSSKFCLTFSVKGNQFCIYRTSLAAPLLCMHIPSGNHFPAYQVFLYCSDYLSLESFLLHKQIKGLPELPEISSIVETITKELVYPFTLGLIKPENVDHALLSPEISYLLSIVDSSEEQLGFRFPVYVNNNNTLSFILDGGFTSFPGAFQICDFSHNKTTDRFANNGGVWASPVFNHQKIALTTFSPSSFIQYYSTNGLTEERVFVFSSQFSQNDIYNQLFSDINNFHTRQLTLLYSDDMRELISSISLLVYSFNYFSLIKAFLTVTENHIEITFFMHRKYEFSMPFSKFFNAIRAQMRQHLAISPDDEVDDDFFKSFRPFTAGDTSRYSDPANMPDDAMEEAYFSVPLKYETLLSLLLELPSLFQTVYDNENNQPLKIVLMNPFL